MAIPQYDLMYKALLTCPRDMQPHSTKEVRDKMAVSFSVADEERPDSTAQRPADAF